MTIKKQCNPKLYRPDKICNPITGRWVLKSSKLGKELLLKQKRKSASKPKTPSIEPKASLMKNNNNNKSNKKNIFLSIFAKIQKPKIDIYSMKHVGQSQSRTRANMYRVSLKHSNPDNIIKKYGDKETHQLHAFVKISKLPKTKDPKMRLKSVRQSPTMKEVELFRVTNMLQDDDILDTVAYCLNDKLLKQDWSTFDKENFSFLTTEDLVGYTPFFDQKFKTVPFDIILQLMYTFSCFQHIGLKHMDLHMWNFYVKKRQEPVHLKFDMKLYDNFESFYIQSLYKIKIIDFDGGSKVKVPGLKQKYSQTITNPKIYSGITRGQFVPTHKVNFLKMIHSLVRYNESRMKTLTNYHNTMYKYTSAKFTNNNGNVPFLSREFVPNKLPNSHKNKVVQKLGQEKILRKAYATSKGTYHQSLLKTYGFFGKYVQSGPRFFNIPRKMVRPLDDVLMDMKLNGIFQHPLPNAKVFSQKELFLKKR